jgi:hypothetical protein
MVPTPDAAAADNPPHCISWYDPREDYERCCRLATQMLRYLRDPALRESQGKAGRARVERDFDGATQARRIQNEIVRAAGLAEDGIAT